MNFYETYYVAHKLWGDDYFLEVPEDFKPKEIETKLSELKNLCRSICEKAERT